MGRWLYVLYWSECLFRGTFSLWLLTYLHCVYLALWTRKVFVWKFYAPYKNIKIKNKNSLTPLFEATPWHQYNKRQLTRKPRTALGTGTTISPARETIVKYQSPMISVDGANYRDCQRYWTGLNGAGVSILSHPWLPLCTQQACNECFSGRLFAGILRREYQTGCWLAQ